MNAAESPEEVTRRVFRAIEFEQWDRVADFVAPDAVESFVAHLRTWAREQAKAYTDFAGVESNAELLTLAPREVLTRYLAGGASPQSRELRREYRSTSFSKPGEAEVTYTVSTRTSPAPYGLFRLRVRRVGDGWYLAEFLSVRGIPVEIVHQKQIGWSIGTDHG